MISEEETEDIKKKLISHIETNFPPEQILSAKGQIESMNSEQLEKFLEKNNIMVNENEGNSEAQCVFCAIASGKIKSVKLEENDNAVAVLEINPISKGHFIVIQKEHSESLSKEAKSLAEEVAEKIKEKFSPKRIEMSESKLFGHAVMNVLPVYEDESFSSEKHHAALEELEEIKTELERPEKPKEKIEEVMSPKKVEEFLWLPKRIP